MILGLEFPPISHVVEWPTSGAARSASTRSSS